MPTLWLVASAILALLSLGISGLAKLLLCLLVLILGCLAVLYITSGGDDSDCYREVKGGKQKWERMRMSSFRPQPVPTGEKMLTWVPLIDEQLRQILNYAFRDYVRAWQRSLSHTNEFSQHLQDVAEGAIANLADKIGAVDWVTFLTTRLVNDVANHVRLFKKARLLLKTRNSPDSSNGGSKADLESMFFDAEVSSSAEQQICRDLVCTIHQEEIAYLQDLSEILLFLLLPKEDFGAQSLRTLTRELLVNVILKPVLDLLGDPDFLNQNIVWLYKDYPIKPEVLSLTIRHSESLEELQATRESVNKEIELLRAKDSSLDTSLKQQLNSLLYLRKAIDERIHRLQSGSETDSIGGLPAQVDWNQMIGPGLKLFPLPIDVILKNNLALGYFIDYMTSIGCQAYIFFFLNIEGWKVSAEQHFQLLSAAAAAEENSSLEPDPHRDSLMDNMREAAHSIYEEYLSEKANPRLKLDETCVKRLLFRIRTEPPDTEWFAEVQLSVFEKLETDERFLNSFKRSMGYVKLLAELDLLKGQRSEEEESLSTLGSSEYSIYDTLSLNSNEEVAEETSKMTEEENNLDATITKESEGGPLRTHKRIGSDSYQQPTLRAHHRNASHGNIAGSNGGFLSVVPAATDPAVASVPILTAEVGSYECVRTAGVSSSYALYKIHVRSRNRKGAEERHFVFRRYSDFYALHDKVVKEYQKLAKLPFPKKKAFGNMDTQVLEQRLKMLHDYLQELLRTEVLEQNLGLLELLHKFLADSSYEEERSQASNVAKAVGSVRSSVKSVSTAVTSVPSHLINTVDNVMDGITRVLLPSKLFDQSAVVDSRLGGIIETDSGQDNIPLRIALLFMDEVFDLQERNQWLRRQIVAMLRQILKAMFGDWANRRIVDYFSQLTSPTTLSSHLKSLKDSLWPNGFPAAAQPPRDENAKMRTRVAAKMALLSSLSEELRRVIGSETSRSGLLTLFDMLQHPVLNKRLAIVLLEAVLDAVFQGQDFPAIFAKLHSRSPRVKNELRNSQRQRVDLRRC